MIFYSLPREKVLPADAFEKHKKGKLAQTKKYKHRKQKCRERYAVFPCSGLYFFLPTVLSLCLSSLFPPRFCFLLLTYPLRQYNNPQQCNQAFPHILADMFLLPRKRFERCHMEAVTMTSKPSPKSQA